MPKLNKFSLYLAKTNVKTFEEVLTANARDLIKRELAKTYSSPDFAQGAVLYTFPGQLFLQSGWGFSRVRSQSAKIFFHKRLARF